MKVKIRRKSKSLNESLTTGRYLQTLPNVTTGDVKHAPEEVQDSRIEIAINIDRFLQRPFLTVGEEIMNDDGEEVTITDPKDTNLLLYVYRGIGKDGEILKGENLQAVNRELEQRVHHFLMGLSPFDQRVLASDIDALIGYIAAGKKQQKDPSHASTYMLKNAPGHFDEYLFATRRRSVYKDTRAGKDFMLKKTPELKNIPEQHHFLFSMENLMLRVKKALKAQPEESVPPLDDASYDANYRLGTTTETVQKDFKSTQANKSMVNVAKNFFVTFYSNPTNYKDLSVEDQIELMTPWFVSMLLTTKDNLEKDQYPKEFADFITLYQKSDGELEDVLTLFMDEYGEVVDSYLDGMEAKGYIT